MSAWLFALLGACAGAAQAGMLARAARGGVRALGYFTRMALVAAALLVAARAGYLFWAAAGWFVALVACVTVMERRLR